MAAAQVLQAGLLPNPEFSYSLDAPVGGVRAGKVTAFGLGLDWEVSRLLGRSARQEAARDDSAALDLDIAWKEWQGAQAARLHPVNLFWIKKQLHLAKRRSRILDGEEAVLGRAEQAGEATALELAAVERTANAARLEVQRIQGEKESERIALNRAVGFPPTAVIPLQPPAISSPEPIPPLKTLLAGLDRSRLDLVALRIGYVSQEERLRAAIREQFPSLSLGLTGGRDSDRLQTAGFGITIGLPLFDRNQAKIAAATATRKELFDEYASRLFSAREDVAALRSKWATAAKQIGTLRNTLPSLRRRAAACETAMESGDQTRESCLPLTEAALAGEAEFLQHRRLQDELGVSLDLVTGTWHQSRIQGGGKHEIFSTR